MVKLEKENEILKRRLDSSALESESSVGKDHHLQNYNVVLTKNLSYLLLKMWKMSDFLSYTLLSI